MTAEDAPLISLADYERAAASRLPVLVYDYFASGAGDELTLRRNREAFDSLALRPRVLRGVGEPETQTWLLGQVHPLPLVVAPTAFARLAHPDGELAIARACAAAGITQTLSTLSTTSLEAVAAAAPDASRWFQVYVFRDRAVTEALVRRAEAAGYEALVVTVDAPVLGTRERDVRNGFALPDGLYAENLTTGNDREVRTALGGSGLAAYFSAHIDPTLTWEAIEWLDQISELPVIVKGVLRGDDAALAVQHGASGIVVSNHGGRQLDTSPATLEVLPEIVSATGGVIPVLLDGGVRRGTDIVKALAFGADAVMIGRPVLWGLAVDGEAGVTRVLQLLRAELEQALTLLGCRALADLDDSYLL